MSRHAISPAGLALVQEFEGFRAEPARMPDGAWVVGYGHVRIGEAGVGVSEAEAGELLALDLAPVERCVNAAVMREITQAQFDALVSFAFSVGFDAFETSAVLRRVNGGDFVAAACAMDAWRKSDASGELEIIDALIRRRAAEKAHFLKDSAHDAAPSAFMRAKLDHAASILGAPVKYAPAPDVASIPYVETKPEAVSIITEVLMSAPVTAALLLTRLATEEEVIAEDEIVTAHAKPVARIVEDGRRALKRALDDGAKPRAQRFPITFGNSIDTMGLAALSLFGLGLVALGGWTLFGGEGDAMDVFAAFALAVPGLAAISAAAWGLWRSPVAQRA